MHLTLLCGILITALWLSPSVTFFQYVTCPTRHGKVLDLCYGTIRGAYKSYCKAPLGTSDHNSVHLVPVYQPTLKREKTERKDVMVWSEVWCCFECTNWEIF